MLVCGSVVSRVYVYLYIRVFVEVAVFRGSVRFALIRFVSFFYGHDQVEIIIWLSLKLSGHVAVGLKRSVVIHILGTYSVLNDMKLTRDKKGNLSFALCIGAGAFSGCLGAFAASPMYMVSFLGPLLFLQLHKF